MRASATSTTFLSSGEYFSYSTISIAEMVAGAPFLRGVSLGPGVSLAVGVAEGVALGAGVSTGVAEAEGEGVADLFFFFPGEGDFSEAGVSAAFARGFAVADGLGLGEVRLRCLWGVGVGVEKICLILLPNDSSAAPVCTSNEARASPSRQRQSVFKCCIRSLAGEFLQDRLV